MSLASMRPFCWNKDQGFVPEFCQRDGFVASFECCSFTGLAPSVASDIIQRLTEAGVLHVRTTLLDLLPDFPRDQKRSSRSPIPNLSSSERSKSLRSSRQRAFVFKWLLVFIEQQESLKDEKSQEAPKEETIDDIKIPPLPMKRKLHLEVDATADSQDVEPDLIAKRKRKVSSLMNP
jgi:hypothetical protein